MTDSRLLAHEQAYRSASQGFDYFVTGLSALLLVVSMFFTGSVGTSVPSNALALTSIVLFALAVAVGLKKLQYYVVILGTNYSIAQTESEGGAQTVKASSRVLSQLDETVQQMSKRASVAHRLRNWFLALGVLTLIASRVPAALSSF